MDRTLARKIRGDKEFAKRLQGVVAAYVKHGFDAVAYWTGEWDTAHDLLMAYAPLEKSDFEKLEKGHPRNFILPMTTTQIVTATTFIAQMLFGQDSPYRVEGRGGEDELPAEHLNTLLRWNAEQQPTFLLGYLWIQDALTYNRGVWYTSWSPITRPVPTVVDAIELDVSGDPVLDEEGNPIQYTTVRSRDEVVGGYCRYEVISPYDFCCDPSTPLWKFQEGRYAAHRFKVPWTELVRRSKLDPDHPAYVMPEAVQELKERRTKAGSPGIPQTISAGGAMRSDSLVSRTHHERMKATNPLSNEAVNCDDNGIVECVELWARLVPKDQGIHDGESPAVFQFIMAGGDILLSVNESTYSHGGYPYAVGESRPSAHYQFSPGYALLLKGLQDHVDYLKNRHQEALQRTVGNVFIIDPDAVDVKEFLDPDKEGLIISLKPNAAGRKISEVIQQVPIKDLTERFPDEMESFVRYSETVSGATAQMQGNPGESGSATEFAGTQQMAAGRMSAVARLLSVQGLVPKTRQIVCNFQQFMEDTQLVRYQPNIWSGPEELKKERYLSVGPDTIQGEFDFIAHDGSLPGTDARKVAAITRVLEGAAMFPQLFSPAPGNPDPRKLVFAAAKASGVDLANFLYDDQSLGNAVQGTVSAQMGVVPSFGGPAQPPPPGGPPQPPGPAPAVPSLQTPELPGLPPATPPQVRPSAI